MPSIGPFKFDRGVQLSVISAINQLAALMSSSAPKVVSNTVNTANASASVSYTGVGFKPTAIVVIAIVNATSELSFGLADAVSQWVIWNDHANVANTWQITNLLVIMRQSATAFYNGTLSSLDADGFTISWAKNGATVGTAQFITLCFP